MSHRANFLAKVEAHARATQALRSAKQSIVAERETSKRKKRIRRGNDMIVKRMWRYSESACAAPGIAGELID
jgi:hypothetical protein